MTTYETARLLKQDNSTGDYYCGPSACGYTGNDHCAECGQTPQQPWVLTETLGGVHSNTEMSNGIATVFIDWDEINVHNEEYTCGVLDEIEALPEAVQERIKDSIANAWPGFLASR